MIILRLLLTFVFAVNLHFIHAQMKEYIDADNFHAAQNITYGFKPWDEHENALQGGVDTIFCSSIEKLQEFFWAIRITVW